MENLDERKVIVDGEEVLLEEPRIKSNTPMLDSISEESDENSYEIEQTRKKLTLVPVDFGRKRIAPKEKVFARINVKSGQMYFGKPALDAMGMNNAFYKLSYDVNNNVIAWRFTHNLDDSDWRSRGWKKMTLNNSGQATVSVGRILEAFGKLSKNTYKCEIKKYKDYSSMLDNELYYYIEVKEA